VPTLLAPLLAAAGLGLYFLTTFRLARYRRRPWEFLAITGAGLILAVTRLSEAPGVATWLAAAASLAVALFFVWFVFSFTTYGPREVRPAAGDPFPDFTLPASTGPPFRLADARGRRLLIVCYRGIW
jgi:hypothetical protein